MKSTERHRLKENEVASTVARVKEVYELYHKPILAGLVAVVAILVAAAGLFAWRSQRAGQADAMLADALAVERAQVAPAPAPGTTAPAPPPPGSYPTDRARNEAALARFMAVANAYASSDAGIVARYHAAALLTALGRDSEAVQEYQAVAAAAGKSVYGQMAQLGIADADAAAGRFDKAIAVYKTMAAASDTQLPVDGILMQLGRAYDAAGKQADARQAFKRILDEFPDSPYAADAKRQLDQVAG
jgi:tetratricopeptide (TPR) repeat protein